MLHRKQRGKEQNINIEKIIKIWVHTVRNVDAGKYFKGQQQLIQLAPQLKRGIFKAACLTEKWGAHHYSLQQGTHIPIAAKKHLLMVATKTDAVQLFQDNMRTTWKWWTTLPQKVFGISIRIPGSVFMLSEIQRLLKYLFIFFGSCSAKLE